MSRAYWYTKGDHLVECQDCRWTDGGGGAQGRAARHHDVTGHVVRVESTRTIYYGEDRPSERRWWKSPDRGRPS